MAPLDESGAEIDDGPFTDFDVDGELTGDSLADFSNEWPVVPRGRSVADDDEPDFRAGPCAPAPSDDRLGERWKGRLRFDNDVSPDSPVVEGTWITVAQVVSLVVDGWTSWDILRAHPELAEDDIVVCLAYAAAEENGEL
jgi:hypothetical protein